MGLEPPMNAEVTVDGRAVDPATVVFVRWNFGRQPDPPLPLHPFRLVADQQSFVEWFSPLFERTMAELRDDDAQHGHDPTVDGPRPASLEELFGLARDDRMGVMYFFWEEILSRYVHATDERLQWVGMSLEDIRLEDGKLHVEGLVRRPVRPPSSRDNPHL